MPFTTVLLALTVWILTIVLPAAIVSYLAFKAQGPFGKLVRRRKKFYLAMISPMSLLFLLTIPASLFLNHNDRLGFMDGIEKYGVPVAVSGLFICWGSLIYDFGRSRGIEKG
jgi:hypothetical protein